MVIRRERVTDIRRIHELNCAAFGSPPEATLVDLLRQQAPTIISLAAEAAGEIVGHILFSPIVVDGAAEVRALALAPMAVAPKHQRQGVGTALVHAGLAECRSSGAHAVFVLGHPAYYPRFGFVRASRYGISCEFDVPDEAFFALELVTDALSGKRGVVRYPEAFQSVTHEE